jgi:hypothetical protein
MSHWKTVVILFFLFADIVFSTEHVAVVSSKTFHRSLEIWIKHRTNQGYTVHLVVEPFGKETTTPEQIKDRLKALSEQVPLSAVLLVGHAAENQVPSPLIPCRIIQRFGGKEPQLATDDWYADWNGDGSADCPVGRFPATTPQKLDAMIQKTIRYETKIAPGTWCRQLQLVAGLGGISPMVDGVIESMTRHVLAEAIPGSWEISLLHADWQSPFCPSPLDFQTEMLRTLRAGSLFWVYLGHGNPQYLDPINTPLGWLPTYEVGTTLTTSRGASPRNSEDTALGSSPIALLFCCYGGFLDRKTPSIAEEWIEQLDGPVAVVAASRITMPYGMGVFGVEMLHELVQSQNETPPKMLTLGTLVHKGKQRMLNIPAKEQQNKRSFREMFDSFAKMLDPAPEQLNVQREEHAALFHLFGDPLLRLPIPMRIQMPPSIKVKPGDVLHLEGTLNQSGTVEIELLPSPVQITLRSPFREEFRYDEQSRRANNEEYLRSNQRVLSRNTVELRDGKFSAAMLIPKELSGDYIVRAFWSSQTSYAFGSTKIAAGRK